MTIKVVRSYFDQELEEQAVTVEREFSPAADVDSAMSRATDVLKVLNLGLQEQEREVAEADAKKAIPADAISIEALKSIQSPLVERYRAVGKSLSEARALALAQIKGSTALKAAVTALSQSL